MQKADAQEVRLITAMGWEAPDGPVRRGDGAWKTTAQAGMGRAMAEWGWHKQSHESAARERLAWRCG